MANTEPNQEPEGKKPISVQVSTVIRAFSLTPSQAAKVLAITRSEVYAWNALDEPCDPGRPDHRRLMRLHELAVQWEAYGKGPMRERNLMPFECDDKCIIGYLADNELDNEGVRNASERIEALANRPERSLGTNWREAFRKMGFAGPTPEQQDGIQEDNLSRIRQDY